MSEYSWKNISWNSDYEKYWDFKGRGSMEEIGCQNLCKCFQEVFGLDLSFDGSYFEASISSGIPVILALGAAESKITVSGLPPFAMLRMRKTGSENISMQERVADVNGKVVLTGGSGGDQGGGSISYYFGEIGIETSGYMWTTNSKLQTLNSFWHWCSEEGAKYITTEYDATTKYKDNIYITHPINFLINNKSIFGVRSLTPIQGTLKPNSQPNNWGFSAGWKYRAFNGQVIEQPTLNTSFNKIETDLQTYDTLESFAFMDKSKPIVVADNFASTQFSVIVSSNKNIVYYNDDFKIPLDVENYDVYLIARKSTTTLEKGLREVEEWDNKTLFAPAKSGYYIYPNIGGSVRVGVWITEEETIQTETTSELFYYKLDGHNYVLQSGDSYVWVDDNNESTIVEPDDFIPVEGSGEENKIYSIFTKPTSFTYVFEDILDAEYAKTGYWNKGIIMVRKNYYEYDNNSTFNPPERSYDFKVNWELKIKNFTTLSDYRNIKSYLNKDIYIKRNFVNIMTSAMYSNTTPNGIMVSSLWSGICLKTFLNLLPKYINFLENTKITSAYDYTVGDWWFMAAWAEDFLTGAEYQLSHTNSCRDITATSSDEGSTWAKFGQLSFGAYINDFELLDTSSIEWRLSENNICYAFAVVLMPKEFNPSYVEQLEPTLPEGASLI